MEVALLSACKQTQIRLIECNQSYCQSSAMYLAGRATFKQKNVDKLYYVFAPFSALKSWKLRWPENNVESPMSRQTHICTTPVNDPVQFHCFSCIRLRLIWLNFPLLTLFIFSFLILFCSCFFPSSDERHSHKLPTLFNLTFTGWNVLVFLVTHHALRNTTKLNEKNRRKPSTHCHTSLD